METDRVETRLSLPDKRVLLAFALMVVLGGGNAIAIRFTVMELPPFWGAALRFGGAAALLWAVVIVRRIPLPPRRAIPGTLLFGVLSFGVAWAFIYTGLRTVKPGMAQVLMALTPLLTFFLAILHKQEAFRWRGLLGALVAMTGVGWVFIDHLDANASVLPMLAIVAGAACLGESLVLLKRLFGADPMMLNAVGMSTGAAFLLGLSRVTREAWRLPTLRVTWLSILYVVVIGTVVFFSLLTFVVKHWSASASSYGLVIMPLETVALSAWITGETLDAALLIGGALVLIGVWIGALSGGSSAGQSREMRADAMGEAD